MKKRTVCVVTGTRADYGLLYWLMKEMDADPEMQLQIIATGMHLSPEFGLTYRQIEEDGFQIDEKVEMLLSGDTGGAIAKSIGLGVIGFSDALRRLSPDIVVLLGDRFETFSAAQAALVLRIPTAHIHGGELTEGLIDDPIRHSITKMSHLHFTAAEMYRNRVIQLGEQPDFVFNVGAPGLDHMRRLKLLTRDELACELQMDFSSSLFLITFHPTTLETNTSYEQTVQLMQALQQFPDATLVFTKANADTDGRIINLLIEQFVAERGERTKVFTSLGQLRYLSCLKHCDVVIGNSSSGIIEAPVFQKATVNIGDRQKGRIKAESVVDCGTSASSITQAIRKAVSDDFQSFLKQVPSLYGTGDASMKIKEKLKTVPLNYVMKKAFYQLDVEK